jgi:hypothetical protein
MESTCDSLWLIYWCLSTRTLQIATTHPTHSLFHAECMLTSFYSKISRWCIYVWRCITFRRMLKFVCTCRPYNVVWAPSHFLHLAFASSPQGLNIPAGCPLSVWVCKWEVEEEGIKEAFKLHSFLSRIMLVQQLHVVYTVFWAYLSLREDWSTVLWNNFDIFGHKFGYKHKEIIRQHWYDMACISFSKESAAVQSSFCRSFSYYW